MNASSLNHVFRLVWSDRLLAWVPVAEGTPARGKGARAGGAARLASVTLGLSLLGTAAVAAGPAALPTGGQITQGSGSIGQSAQTLTIQQNSQKLVTNWQSFNIGAGHTVQFNQPSATAVALNRVLGSDVSSIQGALRANGQVFLLNPNGVLFSPTAQVDTAGLVASTLALGDADFLAGRYRLSGDSAATVRNEGSINVQQGGGLALVAAKVVNQGNLQGDGGTVALVSGNDVTLDLGGVVPVRIHRGALDSLVENGGAVRADGGHVILTARAADALSRSVINHTGVARARSLSANAQGEIDLLGDMGHGQLHVAGQLDASAPVAGNGGHIETSAAEVTTAAGLSVVANAQAGQAGTWLIDPYNYTINSTAAGNITAALNSGTNVTVTTQSSAAGFGGGASGNGDITVASAITKTAGGNATLTLLADQSIYVNSPITSTSGQLGITLSAANNAASNLGGVNVAANLASNGGRILIGGAGGSHSATQSYGIGYALNTSTSAPAVLLGTNVSITSSGNEITINGRSLATNSGSYSATKGGIYVLSGATVDTGGGMLYMSGVSSGAGADKVFGFGVEANSNTTTTFKTSTTLGAIVVDSQNDTNTLGALGLVNNGNQARVQFLAPSVAHMLFRINNDNKSTDFTRSPPCNASYPNCGTMVIPGGNQSYTSAGYQVVNMAMLPIYVFSGSATRVYDGTTLASGVGLTSLGGPGGFVVGDLGPVGFRTPSKHVGSYTSLTGDAGNPSNYLSGGNDYAVAYYNQGIYTITQKAINSFSAGNKVYDGTTAANVTGSGIVNGDAVTVSATGGFASAGAGNGVTVNVTGVSLTGDDASNYSVTGGGSITTTANITPAPLTVTANDATKTYDGLAYSGNAGATVTGLVNGETNAVLGGTLSYSGNSQGAVNAGSYAITPAGLTSSNYDIAYANGALTVNPATLTLAANAASRTYGASNPSLAGSVTGFVNGETAASATSGTLAFTSPATSASHVGNYAINGSGLVANHGNYTFAQDAGNAAALAVTPATLTLTATGATRTYGAANPALTGAVTGLVNGDTLASATTGGLAFSTVATTTSPVGSYAVTGAGLTANHGNYTFAQDAGNAAALAVTPAPLTVTANSASKTYNGVAWTGGNGVAYGGFVNGETAAVLTGTLAYTGNSQGAMNAGSYAITPGGLSAGNYALSFVGGTLTVSPVTLSLAGGGTSGGGLSGSAAKVYNANTQATLAPANFVFSGWVGADGATVTQTTGSYDNPNVGTGKTVTVALGSGDYTPTGSTVLANYVLPSIASGAIGSITPAPLALTAAAQTKVYDRTTSATALPTASGLQGSDTVSGLLQAYADKNAGTGKTLSVTGYTVNDGNGGGNYTVATVDSTAGVITRAAATATAASASTTYNGNTQSPSAVIREGFLPGDEIVITGMASGRNAGTYGSDLAVAGADAGNYTVTLGNANLVIQRAALTLSAAAETKTYDGTTTATGLPTAAGLQGSDTASNLVQAFVDKHAGTGKTLSVTGYTVNDGNGGGNYTVATVDSTAGVITRAVATATAAATTTTYNGNLQSQGDVTREGFVPGDRIVITGMANSRNAGTYGSDLAVSGEDAGNYTVTLGNANLVVNRAPLTLTAIAEAKTYDGTTTATGTPTVAGLVGSDTASNLAQAFVGKDAGSGKSLRVVSHTVNDGNGGNNYEVVTTESTAGVVTPATLTITVLPDTRPAGTANPAFTGEVSGFVAGEALADATTGTLSFATTAATGSPTGVYAVSGEGLQARFGNYVFVQAPGNAQGLRVTAGRPAVEPVLPRTAPVPNFPDNALQGLAANPQRPDAGNLNYISLNASSTPAPGTSTPAAAVVGGAGAGAGAGSGSAAGAGGSADTSPAVAGTETDSTADAAAPTARSRTARPGVAGTAVPSANGPLDIFVVDGGINTGRTDRSPSK